MLQLQLIHVRKLGPYISYDWLLGWTIYELIYLHLVY